MKRWLDKRHMRPGACLVVEKHANQSREYVLNTPASRLFTCFRYGVLAFNVLFVAAWTLVLAFALTQEVRDQWAGWDVGSAVTMVLLCAIWLAGVLYGLWFIWPLLTPIRPETVTLGESVLQYDPGSLPAIMLRLDFLAFFLDRRRFPSLLAAWRRPVSIPRSDLVRAGATTQASDSIRIYWLADRSPIELGRSLPEAERADLLASIKAWVRSPMDERQSR